MGDHSISARYWLTSPKPAELANVWPDDTVAVAD